MYPSTTSVMSVNPAIRNRRGMRSHQPSSLFNKNRLPLQYRGGASNQLGNRIHAEAEIFS